MNILEKDLGKARQAMDVPSSLKKIVSCFVFTDEMCFFKKNLIQNGIGRS